jgi:hypothetical protein
MKTRRMVVKYLKHVIWKILHKIRRTTFKGVERLYTKTVRALGFNSIRTRVVAVLQKPNLFGGKTLYPANTNESWWKFGHLSVNQV